MTAVGVTENLLAVNWKAWSRIYALGRIREEQDCLWKITEKKGDATSLSTPSTETCAGSRVRAAARYTYNLMAPWK